MEAHRGIFLRVTGSCHHGHPKNLLSMYYVQDSFMGAGDSVVNRKPLGEGTRPTLDPSRSHPCPEGSPSPRLRVSSPRALRTLHKAGLSELKGDRAPRLFGSRSQNPALSNPFPARPPPPSGPPPAGVCVSRVLSTAHLFNICHFQPKQKGFSGLPG